MMGMLIASVRASLYTFLHLIACNDKHNIVLTYTSAVECVAIECTCGRVFWRK